jgi:glycosyltransferase involved in cell wall biosynthesis
VVTSVYQCEATLEHSLASVLEQDLREIELIVVDDGSTDSSAALLDALVSRDPRVRVLRQANRGLTAALIRGCGEARGACIARHDADDLSLPGRLSRQVARLRADDGLAFVSCWSRVLGPRDELLLELRRPAERAAAERLLTRERAGPPGHGSVMFRADAYRRVGGYREAFRYAQDWDLWLRLVEAGGLTYEPAFLYAFRVDETSLSSARRSQQQRLGELARACRDARLRGASEAALLAEAARVSAEAPPARSGRDPGNTYFIGKCLLDRRDPRCLPYLRRARRERPWAWRPHAAWLLACLRFGHGATAVAA